MAYKTLRVIATLFFSSYFQWSFSNGKFVTSQLYLFLEGLIFVVLCGFFLFFNATVIAYWKHLSSFLLMGFIVAFLFFIQSGESVYDPPWLGFTLWHYNTINEHNQKHTHYLSSIVNYFDIYF